MKTKPVSLPKTAARGVTAKTRGKACRGKAPAVALAPLPPLRQAVKKILIPVDFSKQSKRVVRYALALAAQFGAEVTLAHVIEYVIYAGDVIAPPFIAQEYATEREGQVRRELAPLAATYQGKIKQVVRTGRVWQEIVKLAEEEKSGLIIIATHGYTGLQHVLLGSVAEKVVRHAPCPVLVVR